MQICIQCVWFFCRLNINTVGKKDQGQYECLVHAPNETLRFHRQVTLKVAKIGKGILPISSTTQAYYPSEDYEDQEDRPISCNYDSVALTTAEREIGEGTAPFLCFDLDPGDKRRMSHFMIRPAGSSVNLNCNPRGYPTPEVKWLKDGMEFRDIGYQHKINRNFLNLKDVNQNDGGSYVCQISNGYKTLRYEIKLNVQRKYRFFHLWGYMKQTHLSNCMTHLNILLLLALTR